MMGSVLTSNKSLRSLTKLGRVPKNQVNIIVTIVVNIALIINQVYPDPIQVVTPLTFEVAWIDKTPNQAPTPIPFEVTPEIINNKAPVADPIIAAINGYKKRKLIPYIAGSVTAR